MFQAECVRATVRGGSRRQRCFQCCAAKPSASRGKGDDLLQIPGVGQRTRAALVKHNVDSVQTLCRQYVHNHRKDKASMKKFLQDVGVRKRWLKGIVVWVDEQASAMEQQVPLVESSRLTFCVEGNVGAGKSTWLDMVKNEGTADMRTDAQEIIEVVPEPVAMWQDVNGDNLLDLFYHDPLKHAFCFQQYVLVTRLSQEKATRNFSRMRLIERSVFCDRMVFVKAVHALEQLSNVELQVYDSWFNPILQSHPQLVPDAFVYLRTNAETCERRIKLRSRSEEAGIQLAYLEQLQDFHDKWLVNGSRVLDVSKGGQLAHVQPGDLCFGQDLRTTSKLLPADPKLDHSLRGTSFQLAAVGEHSLQQGLLKNIARQPVIPDMPEILRGNIVLLDSEKLSSSAGQVPAVSRLHLVPALHVDCVDDVDITDPEVISHRCEMMNEFRNWVVQYKIMNFDLLHDVQSCNEAAGGLSGLPPGAFQALGGGSLESLFKA